MKPVLLSWPKEGKVIEGYIFQVELHESININFKKGEDWLAVLNTDCHGDNGCCTGSEAEWLWSQDFSPVSGAMGLAGMQVRYQHDDTAPVQLMDAIMISSRKTALEMICYGKITCLFMFLHARPWFWILDFFHMLKSNRDQTSKSPKQQNHLRHVSKTK